MRLSVLGRALAIALSGAAAAQENVARTALPLRDGSRLCVGGDGAPAVVVLALEPSVAAAVRDAVVLRALLAAAGPGDGALRGAVVLPQLLQDVPPALEGLDVAAADLPELRRLRALQPAAPTWVVLQRGAVAFAGRPEHGIEAVVRAALRGELEGVREVALQQERTTLLEGLDDLGADDVRRRAEALLAHRPTDGEAHALRFLADADLRPDAPRAAASLQDALAALAAAPRALARFADLALRSRPCPPDRAALLAAALERTPGAADDLVVQLARLRALVAARQGREVGRAAHRLARRLHGDARLQLDFVSILAADDPAAVHKDLVATVLRELDGGTPEVAARELCAARYVVALRCEGDARAARAIARDYMEPMGGRVMLNNDAWYFLTEASTRGRYDPFALVLVERMLEQRAAMDWFEFDTAALAMFRNGRVQEAIELQQLAVERGGKDNQEYQERLGRYRAAAGAAPR